MHGSQCMVEPALNGVATAAMRTVATRKKNSTLLGLCCEELGVRGLGRATGGLQGWERGREIDDCVLVFDPEPV